LLNPLVEFVRVSVRGLGHAGHYHALLNVWLESLGSECLVHHGRLVLLPHVLLHLLHLVHSLHHLLALHILGKLTEVILLLHWVLIWLCKIGLERCKVLVESALWWGRLVEALHLWLEALSDFLVAVCKCASLSVGASS